ncbi:MAG: efflux RND transporter periplasmic adaptor subunit [Rhizobacter sp.]|nr:efflux RND transporter periplasmic adaptor subunit [Chlorobiales bacterium]
MTKSLLLFRSAMPVVLTLSLAITLSACTNKETQPIEASGIIETTDVNLSAKAVGTVISLRVREGDQVRRGDTLAVIDPADLKLQAEQLQAGVDLSKAQYDLLRNGSRSEDVAQASEGVSQAKATLDNAKDDFDRYEKLYKSGSVAEKQFADVKTHYEVAQRQYGGLQSGYQKLRRGSRSEDLAAAKARLTQSEAILRATQKKISDCYLTSPAQGIITKRAVEEGEFVSTGAQMLTVSKTETVKLKIYVAEDELGKVKVGQNASLKIDTFKDKRYSGKVTYISPAAEFTPKNVQTKDDRVKLVFEVQVEVHNPQGELKSGLTAEATLDAAGSLAEKK